MRWIRNRLNLKYTRYSQWEDRCIYTIMAVQFLPSSCILPYYIFVCIHRIYLLKLVIYYLVLFSIGIPLIISSVYLVFVYHGLVLKRHMHNNCDHDDMDKTDLLVWFPNDMILGVPTRRPIVKRNPPIPHIVDIFKCSHIVWGDLLSIVNSQQVWFMDLIVTLCVLNPKLLLPWDQPFIIHWQLEIIECRPV